MKAPVIQFFIILFILSSCSFNKSIFDTSILGEPIPDTVSYKNIYTENHKGIKLHACFFKPKISPRASVFMLLGESGDIKLWYDAIEVMLRNGFQVFVFEYQGIGESMGKPGHANLLEDGQLMLKEFLRIDDIKGTKIIGWSFSLGTNLAVKLAYDNPGSFDYLILDSPYISQRSFALNKLPLYKKIFGLFFANSPYASKKLIGKLRDLPVLIVYSIEDQQSSYTYGEKLFKLARKPKLFFESLGPHCYSLIDHESLYIERVQKLLTY